VGNRPADERRGDRDERLDDRRGGKCPAPSPREATARAVARAASQPFSGARYLGQRHSLTAKEHERNTQGKSDRLADSSLRIVLRTGVAHIGERRVTYRSGAATKRRRHSSEQNDCSVPSIDSRAATSSGWSSMPHTGSCGRSGKSLTLRATASNS